MLDLARKLSDCDAKYFTGWIIAGLEVMLKGEAQHVENSVPLAKARRCIHEARGYDKEGKLVQSLRLFIVLPAKDRQVTVGPLEERPSGEPVYVHSFCNQEIEKYVSATGDENIIHKGQKPLVPGICMLCGLQQQLGLSELKWRVSFLAPVYAGQQLEVYETVGGLAAYVGRHKVFVVKI